MQAIAQGKALGNIALTGILALMLLAPQSIKADCGPETLENVRLEKVSPEGDMTLTDGRKLRLAGLHLVQRQWTAEFKKGDELAIGLLGETRDRWSRLPSLVFLRRPDASPEWLQEKLIRNGSAYVRPEDTLRGCWPVLTRIEASTVTKPVHLLVEGGRFARTEGRVTRVSDGRSATFIALTDSNGVRVTGMVQKRDLKRFADRNIDLAVLRGQVIRMRGVRNLRNPAIIPLRSADQIEIVR